MSNIKKELDPLFNPKSIAVIGATNNWNKWGHSTFSCSLQGFNGNVYPINLSEETVLGHKAYKKITDVPEEIDLAIFVIPAQNISNVMEDCVTKGVKAGIIISAGFRETGPEGLEMENEVIRIAQKGGIRLVGPNCMGMWSASSNLRAFMFPIPSMDGPIAFVTQGGNVGGAVVSSAYERGLGFHRYVSCGPAADIQIEDYIEYFGEEPEVKIILVYIEGLSDGKRFIEKVSKVTKKKPVIVLKPGKTEAAHKAILSHSGAIAGVDDIYNGAFKKSGVIRVETPEELLDVAIGFLTQPLPSGRNVAIITGGGSYGVICAEYCESLGLDVIELPDDTISAFSEIFPPRWSHGNPVDPAGERNFMAYYLAPEMVLKLDSVDSLIFMGFGSMSSIMDTLFKEHKTLFIGAIPSNLSEIQGLDKIINDLTDAIKSGNVPKMKSLIEPMLPFMASMFGSDATTMDKFLTMMAKGEITRSTLVDLISAIPSISEEGISGMKKIMESYDLLVSKLLFQLMKTFKKPIISTSFSEIMPKLIGAKHPFPTAKKAVIVLSKMVEYSEYLQNLGVLDGDLKHCSILNKEFD